jgi:hypothetical protein
MFALAATISTPLSLPLPAWTVETGLDCGAALYDAGNCDAVPVLQRGAPHAVIPPMHNTGEREFCHDAIMRCARGVVPVQ